MKIWGITAQVHDAAISVIEDGEILFASSSERYSGMKQDPDLNEEVLRGAMEFGAPDLVAYYENPWIKKSRQLLSGQIGYALDWSRMPSSYLRKFGIRCPVTYVRHHESHASAGFYTSSFDRAAVVVIDSVGEWQTISIWRAEDDRLTLLEGVDFPSSLGLLYSAFTRRCGLAPNEEEYIMMGMAAYGEPVYADRIMEDFVDEGHLFRLKRECRYGIGDYIPEAHVEDLAASAQLVAEVCIGRIMGRARAITGCEDLVYMGGVALNCVANSKLFSHFKRVWIMPAPGDAGSSIGCAARVLGRKVKWRGPYLGREIKGDYPVDEMCAVLQRGAIIGVAKGRAEFGPRALGNRSLLADPRLPNIKDRMNDVKRRHKYRPFAPAIPLELAAEYFEMPTVSSPYMQFTSRCRHPDVFSGAAHVDGSSRVQTVSRDDNPNFHELLMSYYHKTGCPMLINTSLNIRGRPIVNDESDAADFENAYHVKVF